MTRSQFRFLVVANQLLVFAAIVGQEIADQWLPAELRAYFGIDQSVLDSEMPASLFIRLVIMHVYYWVIVGAGVIAAIGLCFGKRWGRTLYLLTFIAWLVNTLLAEFYLYSGIPSFFGYLAGTTEGMILALAYFSHIRRMFEPAEEI